MKVTVSVAVSLDGYIDDSSADRLVLSCAEDWHEVYDLRSKCDAILVGGNTVRRDDPSLNIKDPAVRVKRAADGFDADIAKVVVTRTGDIPHDSKFLTTGGGSKIVYHSNKDIPNGVRFGAEYMYESNITASFLRRDLARRGYSSLLVEGGAQVLTMFFEEDAVDELRLAIAPFFVGDPCAPRFVNAGQFPFDKRRRMKLIKTEALGDMAVMYYDLRDKDYEYLGMAVDESRKCVPSVTSYCVGAVIVTADGEIFKGYTHQTGVSNHAEEEAINAAVDAGAELTGATLYSSMEPCSSRKSKPKSCSTLIVGHGFARVVFALREPDNFVRCEGVSMLRAAGVEVVEIESLADEVRRINSHILIQGF